MGVTLVSVLFDWSSARSTTNVSIVGTGLEADHAGDGRPHVGEGVVEALLLIGVGA